MAAGECDGRLASRSHGGAGPLDAAGAMTDNFHDHDEEESTACATRSTELRASRKRLVVAADADRRMIERELHDGVQQHLVALAVNLQLADQVAGGRSRGGEGAPRRDGARRAAGAGRDGAACAADLPAAARGGRPRRGAALGGGERRRPCLPRGRSGSELPARDRGSGLLVLSRGARARRRRGTSDGDGARRGRSASPSRWSRTVPAPMQDSTGCATASRRWAAG